MDQASIVEVTEQTRFFPETDGQTDKQMDRRTYDMKPVYPPFNLVEAGDMTNYCWLVISQS